MDLKALNFTIFCVGSVADSKTFELINEGVADMHCMSDEYLVDELLLEYKQKQYL